jgi:hypothetical protein
MIEAAYDPIQLLQSFVAKQPQGWGGSPGREIPKEELEKMGQPGTPPPEGFFEEWRQRLGQPGVKEAASPSSDPFMVLRTPAGKQASPQEGFLGDWMQRFGQPSVKEAAAKSFDLSYPKIPGRSVEGIPNANDPVMREKLRQRLLRNPEGGQDLPGFLKRV